MFSSKAPSIVLSLTVVFLMVGQASAQAARANPENRQNQITVPQTQPAAISLLEQLRRAPDPSAAISLYAEAAKEATDDQQAQAAFVQRMIELGTPALAEQQARDLVNRSPETGFAWAVLADAAGRRGETANALSYAAAAARASPDDLFVQQTAGKLLAWFDTQAPPAQVTDEMKTDAQSIRAAMAGRTDHRKAYDEAVAFYREQERIRRSEQAQEQPPAQQQPAEQQQQLEQPEYNSYTYNYYTTPEYNTYAYSTPYGYGYSMPYYGYYSTPYYYNDYYAPYYGYGYGYVPTYNYGGYQWPCYSTYIVAPSFWPRYHHYRYDRGFFGHGYYPRYYTNYHRYGDLFGRRHGDPGRYRVDRSFSGGLDRYTSPRGVARDWTRGRAPSASIPRGTFNRGSLDRSAAPLASFPRDTFNRGSLNRNGLATNIPRSSVTTPRTSPQISRLPGRNTYGYVSPSIPRASFQRSPGASISPGRAPRTITRSAGPSVAGRSAPAGSPRIGSSRGISVPRAPGFSRGIPSGRSSGRAFSAAPRISGRGGSPSIARGGFSRGGGISRGGGFSHGGFSRGGISRGGGGFSRGGGGARAGGRR